ncbi:LuxR C-terminal-related transcriptional regulator [Kitasatospora sp. NPDC006697]|uniref:helix-turn-helix transcriptional regulator n=1 Tax=unclassified Kitasatospora TaxID=2633591 RepID=UPI00368ECCE6
MSSTDLAPQRPGAAPARAPGAAGLTVNATNPLRVAVLGSPALHITALASALTRRGHQATTYPGPGLIVPAPGRPLTAVLFSLDAADGTAAAEVRQLHTVLPTVPVIVIGRPDPAGVLALLSAGAAGFVPATTGLEEVEHACRLARTGRAVIAAGLLHDALASRDHAASPHDQERQRLLDALTTRELEVLGLICDGLDTGEISARLGITVSTARTHIQRLLAKLGAPTRLSAAAVADRYSLLADRPAAPPLQGARTS